MQQEKSRTTIIAVLGGLLVMAILVFGTMSMSQSAREDTDVAVRSVSLMYLDELAARRGQVVESTLKDKIKDIQVALELMSGDDLKSEKSLQEYQSGMKRLFNLEKFAFVDEDGIIHTSTGQQNDIDHYAFDYKSIVEPVITIKDAGSRDKKAVIAVPTKGKSLDGKKLVVCFMEIDMDELLAGLSMDAQENGATFCNIYTKDGVALSNTVLGGLAVEDNLLEAMKKAEFDDGYSYDKLLEDFEKGANSESCFTYNGIRESLSYVSVPGTDWMLTYLIRESVISDRISENTDSAVTRGLLQSILTVAVLLAVFAFMFIQNRRNAKLILEREKAETANRVKQQELEEKLALNEKLLEQERQREQQDKLITALASNYRSIYYIELDNDRGICYRKHTDMQSGLDAGEEFAYRQVVEDYARRFIVEPYREDFLAFVEPDAVRKALKKELVVSYTYKVFRHGREAYEAVRFAGVRRPDERDDHIVHNVGMSFTDVDEEIRKSQAEQQALSDALAAAEEVNKAKTAFLSNMSHEIRTPMNAIIGLDNIALNDPETPEKTKEYLAKIGSSAEHLLGLINDILDMSRIESGRMNLKNEEFSFGKLLEAINIMFSGQCSDKGLDYRCYVDGDVDDYYIGDNMKLRQVLINILGNAVKFTPEGGKVRLEVKRTMKFDGKSTLRFRIADTGIGMSEEFMPHIFDTFAQEDSSSTNKYGSSGLGLAITKSIVEMMNGNIQVESKKGEGSTFTVTVTLMDSDAKDADRETREVDPKSMSVLIVDDDEVACRHAKLVLEKAGIASETASSGEEAVEMVRLRHARRDPYNLILVDWQMPEMDGVETTRQIRKITGDESAIIILTAYRWDDVLEEALEAGVDSFIAKPLFANVVIEEFSAALKKKSSAGLEDERRADLDGKRILLAEDVAINAEIVQTLLETRGMSSDLATNGRIAVEMFEKSAPGDYDAVLMDMRMPEMDGLEAAKTIRALDREDAQIIPIIALTANAFDTDVQLSMQAGMNAHLTKPVQPDVLFETLEKLIKE